jgi:dipeptidyl-peptidase-4
MIKKLSLICSAAIFVLSNTLFAQQLKNLTYDDIYASKKFTAKTISELKSMNNGNTFSDMDDNSNIIRYSFSTGKSMDTLLNFNALLKISGNDKFSFTDYNFSKDESKILLTTASETIYRHSSKANYYVYDRKAKTLKAVSPGGKQMYATFSPDGKRVAFVRDNNLFLKNLSTDLEVAVTTDGKKNEIINGANDWVYEEEFSFSQSYQWSENGNYLAYYRFDENKVREFTLMYYDSLYPIEEKYKYPKAGEQNSTVDIYVYDIASGKKVKADIGSEADQYIPRIQWTKEDNKLCIFRMNRHQDQLELLNCNAASGKTSLLLKEESNTYIEINNDLTFLEDKNHYIRSSRK